MGGGLVTGRACQDTGPVTDDPETDPFRIPIEAIQSLTKRMKNRIGGRTDEQLIGEVDRDAVPHLVNPMEPNRRLKVSIEKLTAEVEKARASSDKLAKTLIWLTVILVILTVALVVLTIKLASATQ